MYNVSNYNAYDTLRNTDLLEEVEVWDSEVREVFTYTLDALFNKLNMKYLPEFYNSNAEMFNWESLPAIAHALEEENKILYIRQKTHHTLFFPVFSLYSSIISNNIFNWFNWDALKDSFINYRAYSNKDYSDVVIKEIIRNNIPTIKNRHLPIELVFFFYNSGYGYKFMLPEVDLDEILNQLNNFYKEDRERLLSSIEGCDTLKKYIIEIEKEQPIYDHPTSLLIVYDKTIGFNYLKRPHNMSAIEYLQKHINYSSEFIYEYFASFISSNFLITQCAPNSNWTLWYKNKRNFTNTAYELKTYLTAKLNSKSYCTFLENVYKTVNVIPHNLNDPITMCSIPFPQVVLNEEETIMQDVIKEEKI